MTARVTVLVPTFNAEATLERTLNSILGQSFTDFIVKIVDNASRDRTLDIARSFAMKDKRVHVIGGSQNLGGEGNFTRCLQLAAGDYSAIFHADDIYEPTMLEKQVQFLDTHPECVAVATHAATIDDRDRVRGSRFLPPELRGRDRAALDFETLLKLTLRYGNFITCPSVMARSTVYREQICEWNGRDFKTSADLDVWLRLCKLGRLGFLTEPLIRYRISSASLTVREVKGRIKEHDIFLVLRHYTKSGDVKDAIKLSALDLEFMQFQKFKDIALRRWNIVRRSLPQPLPSLSGDSGFSLLRLMLADWFHLKYGAMASALYAVTGLLDFFRAKESRGGQASSR